jgi:predicted glycosyltransferase involved in capsule biosynthesis
MMIKATPDFTNVALTFLVKLDTIDRLENVLAVTKFLISNLESEIMVLECSPFNNGVLEKLLDQTVQYKFQEDHDPILHRTKYLNQMIRSVKTPYVAVWDTDVIMPIHQIEKAIELLQNGDADFVYPYEKQFLDTSPILRKLFLETGNIDVLEQNAKKMKEMYVPNPVGGAFLANVKAYKESGLENEDFYGWGMEDGERYHRWENMGYKIKRVPGPLFHLSHGRGINSVFHNADQQFYKRKEVLSTRRNKISMSEPVDGK